MANPQTTLINAMSKLLEEGWTLTSKTCPISRTPLLRDRGGVMFCPKCNAPVVVEDPAAASPGKYAAIAARLSSGTTQLPSASVSLQYANSIPNAAATSLSYPQLVSLTAAAPVVSDDRPPPQPRGKSATDVVSKKLGEKLLQGWRMDKEACGKCGIPLMTPKDSSVQVCIMCEPQQHSALSTATKLASTGAVTSATTSTVDTSIAHGHTTPSKGATLRTSTNDHTSSEKAASRMGVKLVSGWRMNAQSCYACNVPLMSAKGESNQFCVMCESWFDASGQQLYMHQRVAQPTLSATSTQLTSVSAKKSVSAVSNNGDAELDDLDGRRAKVKDLQSRPHSSSEWSAALDDVVNGVRADERSGPGSRTLVQASTKEVPATPAALPYVLAPVLSIAEPSAADIERLARALDKAASEDAKVRDTQLLRTTDGLPALGVDPRLRQHGVRPTNSTHAEQSLLDVLQQQNAKIVQLGARVASEPALLAGYLEAAATIPKLVEAIKALQSL